MHGMWDVHVETEKKKGWRMGASREWNRWSLKFRVIWGIRDWISEKWLGCQYYVFVRRSKIKQLAHRQWCDNEDDKGKRKNGKKKEDWHSLLHRRLSVLVIPPPFFAFCVISHNIRILILSYYTRSHRLHPNTALYPTQTYKTKTNK